MHIPEQQSTLLVQTSPGALQDAAGLQVPSAAPVPDAPWQFVEQQSAGYAQASPSVLQEPFGTLSVGSGWHWPPVQIAEQH